MGLAAQPGVRRPGDPHHAEGAVEVLDGLKPGDRVVIAGSDLFEDAERIRVND